MEEKKIYANQEWGSTKQSYDTMNSVELPDHLKEPTEKVSILISSFNTKAAYVKDCLNSIKNQVGHIFFEIIWINDGSNDLNTKILKKCYMNLKIQPDLLVLFIVKMMEIKA